MQKVHLDTDIGGDIDDLCGLAMLLAWPGVELAAVTTNCDDRGRRAGYAACALRLAGREGVPVAAGADVSLDCYRVRPGLPDEAAYWPQPVEPVATPLADALSLLERSIKGGATIVTIGALTNLALLEKRRPGILREARVFVMGGYAFPPREGFPPWGFDMDWNLQIDARSALLVLQRSSPTLIPVSVTVETALRRSHLPALAQSGPLARLIARQAEAFAVNEGFDARYGATCAGLPRDIINFLHDPLACAVALGLRQGVELSMVPLRSRLRSGWLRQKLDDDGVPTRVVTGVDGAAFADLWLNTVVRG